MTMEKNWWQLRIKNSNKEFAESMEKLRLSVGIKKDKIDKELEELEEEIKNVDTNVWFW